MDNMRNTTRCFMLALLTWAIGACTSTPPNGAAISEVDRCALATKHPAAVALTLAGYNGTLNNYFGEDSTKLDFQHVYENGQVVESRFYYENGQLQEACTFKCQAMHGPRELYFENGKLEQRIPFSYGRREGVGEKYDSTGRLIQRVHFHHDSLIGQVENF
jgi:hypothetical protein